MNLSSASTQRSLRWLHIHISMAMLLVLVFFALTGITLNHPKLFTLDKPQRMDREIQMPAELLSYSNQRYIFNKVQLLHLLKEQGLHGKASEVEVFIEQTNGELTLGEVSIDFKAPAYNASVFVDIPAKTIEISEQYDGLIALLNDLHKGRYSGLVWKAFIDISAVLVIFFAITGVALLIPRQRKLIQGLSWTLCTSLGCLLLYSTFVP